MKKLIALLLVLSTLFLLLCACDEDDKKGDATTAATTAATTTAATTEKPATGLERGVTTGTSYTNKSLGLTFQKPSEWVFYTDEQIAQMMNITASLYKDENLLQSLSITSVIDFMAVNGNTGDNLNLTIENLKLTGNATMTVDEYIAVFKAMVATQTEMKYTFAEGTTQAKLGKVAFTRLECTTTYGSQTMKQFIYLKKIDGYMVTVSMTSISGATAASFEAMFS